MNMLRNLDLKVCIVAAKKRGKLFQKSFLALNVHICMLENHAEQSKALETKKC